jgi:hypothetical protein
MKTDTGSAFETSEAVRIFNKTTLSLQIKLYYDENTEMFTTSGAGIMKVKHKM